MTTEHGMDVKGFEQATWTKSRRATMLLQAADQATYASVIDDHGHVSEYTVPTGEVASFVARAHAAFASHGAPHERSLVTSMVFGVAAAGVVGGGPTHPPVGPPHGFPGAIRQASLDAHASLRSLAEGVRAPIEAPSIGGFTK